MNTCASSSATIRTLKTPSLKKPDSSKPTIPGRRSNSSPSAFTSSTNPPVTEGGLRDGHFDLALLVTDWLAEAHAASALEDLHHWQQLIPLHDWPARVAAFPRPAAPLRRSSQFHSVARRPRVPRLPDRPVRRPCNARANFMHSSSATSRRPPPGKNSSRPRASSPISPRAATVRSSPHSPTATTRSTTSPSSSGVAAAS